MKISFLGFIVFWEFSVKKTFKICNLEHIQGQIDFGVDLFTILGDF